VCGICGSLSFSDHLKSSPEALLAMRESMIHRGPDDQGSWFSPDGRVALGHRRLSIVDLSPAGRQPMSNENGDIWIVYNGEVYNHASLRQELEMAGHVYRSRTDTETVLHLYEELGPDCIERLDGMFAFAIWDDRRGRLFLARDRLGVKPLYYQLTAYGLIFGSEVRAILRHPAVSADLDEESFFHYLTFAFVPAPRTIYAGIDKLAPAEWLMVSRDGSVRRDRYWTPFSPDVAARTASLSDHAAEEHVLELLRRSVRKRMMSDVPFGVFLSGGVDSSTNVALMAEVSDEPVRTYSIAPKQYSAYDELGYARLVADWCGSDHHEIKIGVDDLMGFLPLLPAYQDEPVSDWTGVSQYFVTKLARETGTVVIQVGEGADEIFHGYRGYAQHRHVVRPFQRLLPRGARVLVAHGVGRASHHLGRFGRHSDALLDAADNSIPYRGGGLVFRGPLKEEVLVGSGRFANSYRIPEAYWREIDEINPAADVFQRISYLEIKQRLAELLLMRMDRVTMACSVEGRDPFLDHHLVEFVFSLPPRLKYRRGVGKVVLKNAVRDLLPPEVTTRKKQGFGTPAKEWLRGPFGPEAHRAVRTSSLRERGLLHYEVLDRLFAEHRAGSNDWSCQLWNIYNISRWYDYWIAGRRDQITSFSPKTTGALCFHLAG
jgi:asparagine synthase (glutamine-hydrolysing)